MGITNGLTYFFDISFCFSCDVIQQKAKNDTETENIVSTWRYRKNDHNYLLCIPITVN